MQIGAKQVKIGKLVIIAEICEIWHILGRSLKLYLTVSRFPIKCILLEAAITLGSHDRLLL